MSTRHTLSVAFGRAIGIFETQSGLDVPDCERVGNESLRRYWSERAS